MKVNVHSEGDMQNLGARLAKNLPASVVIELIGDVGAGKTTLVKGLARQLGVTQTVQSPSYTIFCRYDIGKKSLHHYDFYRLSDPGLVSYDLDESLHTPGAITAVEWADNVKGVLPDDRIVVRMVAVGETERQVEIEGAKL